MNYRWLLVLVLLAGCADRTTDLEVKSVPTGATITLDWELTGHVTDFKFERIYAGFHLIELESGNFSWEDTVDLRDGAPRTLLAVFPEFKWSRDLGTGSAGSPAVGPDGTVYVLHYGMLAAWNPDGTARFDVTLNQFYYDNGTPAVADDGTVYALVGGTLYAVSDSGDVRWSVAINTGYDGRGLAIAGDGTVLVTTYNVLYAVAPGGTIAWQHAISEILSAPAIAADGTIYLKTSGGLAAFNPDGTEKWFSAGEDDEYGSGALAVGAEGTVYMAIAGHLIAVSPDGARKWVVTGGSPSYYYGGSGPAIAADGTICVLIGDTLRGIAPDGVERWRAGGFYGGYSEQSRSPAIAADGTIWSLVGADGYSKGVAPGGYPAWHLNTMQYGSFSAVITADSTLFAVTGVQISAIKLASGPAASSWPMYQHDPQRTGRARSGR